MKGAEQQETGVRMLVLDQGSDISSGTLELIQIKNKK
jgi:hypothetical protein